MRSLLLAFSVAVLFISWHAAANELADADVDVAEAHAVNARHLLQGVRSFSKVSSHKNPQQPKMTRKTWERKQPLRMLLDTDVDVAEAHAVNARHLLQGVRSFSKVSSHKNPQQPKMTRKTWERKQPLRMLLDTDVDVAEAHAVNARHLLQGVRSFSKVSSHKNPQQPKMTRKTWERKQPLRMLLDTDVDVAETHAVNARHLLQGVRSFSKVSSHKNPQQPKMTRKTWERKQPLRMLLDTDVDVAEAHAVNARHLLQGVRSFSKVSSHKNPQQPKMTRKTWERKMP